MRQNKIGLIHFFSHLLIEIISFYIMESLLSTSSAFLFAILYDFLAFIPQGIFGFIYDSKIKIPFYLIGIILTFLSLILLNFEVNEILILLFLALGNSLIHIIGAEETIRGSKGKMTPLALFVSGGSFGLIIGQILGEKNISPLLILLFILPLLLIAIFRKKLKISEEEEEVNLSSYNYSNPKISSLVIILLTTFVVFVRSFIGYAIPTSWKKELYQNIIFYFLMGGGKLLGGVLIDKIGIRKTSFISTIISIPFLLFGDNILILSILGVMAFSMSMAVTVAILISSNRKYPGVSFGFTTIGLFLGSMPIYLFSFPSILMQNLTICLLSIISFIILEILSRKEKKNES